MQGTYQTKISMYVGKKASFRIVVYNLYATQGGQLVVLTTK